MPMSTLRRLRAFRFAPEWKKKTGELDRKLSEFYRLFKSKKYPTPDELFFEIEDLPSFGKEYWFLHFCAPPNEEQVILTVGRSVDPVRVNDKDVPEGNARDGVMCAAVCWLYSQKQKQVLFDSTARMRLEKGQSSNLLEAKDQESKMTIKGKYPSFSVELARGKKRIFSARAVPPKEGLPYELVHLMKTPLAPRFGAAMINYYFDFTGTLHGKKMSGKAYLQKVVAVLPLAPWNWVRLHFSKGATIDFFAGKPLGQKSQMHFACNDYVELDGRRFKLSDLKLKSYLEGEKKIWVLSGKNLFVVMESYALQPFVMRQKTTFCYDEYIVKVRALAIREVGKEYSLADFGEGVGLVEDAYGYLL